MRQIFGDIGWEKKAAVFFVLVVMFVVVGPFGTYEELTLAERISFWTALMAGVGFFMHIGITLALRSPYLAGWPDLAKVVVGAAIAAVPGAAIVEFVNEVFRPSGVRLSTMLRIWGQVTLVGSVVGAVEYIDWRSAPDKATPVLTPFHARMQTDLGTDIISLSMQDHYVEVTTTAGKEMILMRFADALAEIAPLPGARVHRSHWIAAEHLRSMSKSGGRHLAEMSDGRTLPVSSTYLPDVQKLLPKEN